MKHSDILGRIVRSLGLAGVLFALTFSGCTEVDDTLGAGFAPDNQRMKTGRRTLKPCFKTSLFRTEGIRTSNIRVGLMGSTLSDTFGLRTAGFYTQYTWGECPDEEKGFGYRPVFDSILLGLSVTGFGGDTTAVNTFEVYEVIDDAFLKEHADTVFYGNFDMKPYLSAEPIFTFEFPDQKKGVYTTSTAVRLHPTAGAGRDFIERLMLQKGPYAGNVMTGFTDTEDWISRFKGIYVMPAQKAASKQSGIYQLDLTQSGMVLFGRNRVEEDPTLIRDTTTSLYYFYDEYTAGGKVSINTFERDYSQSLLAGLKFDEEDEERSETTLCHVEGMAGVVTEIEITKSFFEQIERILEDANAEQAAAGLDTRFDWRSLAVNQATLTIYDQEMAYEWATDPNEDEYVLPDWDFTPSVGMIDRMDTYLPRLGIYTSYKDLKAIPDYAYAYEASYGTVLAYGGYMNRSRGCYTMDISMYVQELWNKYRELRELSPGAGTDELVGELGAEARTIYLAPEAYGVNDFRVMSGQGMEGGGNKAPMKLDLTYTLIK